MKIKELSKKEVKDILRKICEEYDIDYSKLDFLIKDFVWFVNKDGKLFILHKEARSLIYESFVQRLGLYIAKVEKDGIRLSIEGSHLFGPFARKKIIELDIIKWMLGEDIKTDVEYGQGFYIVKSGKYFLGSTKIKNSIAKNFVPKNRRLPMKFNVK